MKKQFSVLIIISIIALITVILEISAVTFFSKLQSEQKPIKQNTYTMKSQQRDLPDVPISHLTSVTNEFVNDNDENKDDIENNKLNQDIDDRLSNTKNSKEERNIYSSQSNEFKNLRGEKSSFPKHVKTSNYEQSKVENESNSHNTIHSKKEYQLIGNKKTALVVITYNRPNYLLRTINRVFEVLQSDTNHYHLDMFISQDGNEYNMKSAIEEIQTRIQSIPAITHYTHFNHEQVTLPNQNNYFKLARHFKWIFDKVLFELGYDQIIVLEDDLDISIDFFEYFSAVSPLVWSDTSLLAASAWNDNGFSKFINDPENLVRSDFFPGLGWLLTKPIWNELSPIWPEAYWDDWLRNPLRRKNRAIIRPEISRTFTFGESGTSNSQFYNEYLKPIYLNTIYTPFTKMNLNYLRKPIFDIQWKESIEKAAIIPSNVNINSLNPENTYKILYRASRGGYEELARQIGLMANTKAGVPRGAYMGTVPIKLNGATVYIAPKSGPSFNYIE